MTIKNLWKTINESIGKNKNKTHKLDMADRFCEYYCQLGKTGNNFSNHDDDFKQYLKRETEHSVYFYPTDKNEIY